VSQNQCMGCQAGWPLDGASHLVPPPGYLHERVGCTRDRYEARSVHGHSSIDAAINSIVASDKPCARLISREGLWCFLPDLHDGDCSGAPARPGSAPSRKGMR
jgi:hypothetical protein